MKYAWIQEHRDEFSVNAMCEFLSVSRSAYYGWVVRSPTALEQEDAELVEAIKKLFEKGRSNYGTRIGVASTLPTAIGRYFMSTALSRA